MNVNYKGSLAERKLRFSSTVTVENVDNSDLFNAISIYMPKSFSALNLVDFDPGIVTADSPALVALTVDNYAENAKGDLLSQIQPMFRDDTNFDLTVFIIVFSDSDTTPTLWEMGEGYITFEPLTKAYQELYFLSYVKMLFDPNYDGENVTIAGVASTLRISISNGGADPISIPADTYSFTAGDKTFEFTLESDQLLAAGISIDNILCTATTVGTTTATTSTAVAYDGVTPNLDSDADVEITSVIQGSASVTRPSIYFDLALAMAYQAKSNIQLSSYFALVKLDWDKIDLEAGTDTNKCQIRAKTLGEEEAAMTNIATGDRVAYFYGALRLMVASNTCVLVDCESRNLISLLFNAWFESRNSSGEYVGNKMSLVRITDAKCFGPVSQINSAYNSGDSDGYDIFDEKNVGCLVPISSTNSGDSVISMCRGVTGIPIGAFMIAKFVDYRSGQNCADMISDKGTLTDPVLMNEETYQKIQNIVLNNLGKFTGTKRITSIVAKFPSFEQAKVGRTAISVASSWSAVYVDDLDTINISGGIVAQ